MDAAAAYQEKPRRPGPIRRNVDSIRIRGPAFKELPDV
jgi:hypothetical protein